MYTCMFEKVESLTKPSSKGMICNLPGCVSQFLGNTKYQEINFSMIHHQSNKQFHRLRNKKMKGTRLIFYCIAFSYLL